MTTTTKCSWCLEYPCQCRPADKDSPIGCGFICSIQDPNDPDNFISAPCHSDAMRRRCREFIDRGGYSDIEYPGGWWEPSFVAYRNDRRRMQEESERKEKLEREREEQEAREAREAKKKRAAEEFNTLRDAVDRLHCETILAETRESYAILQLAKAKRTLGFE